MLGNCLKTKGQNKEKDKPWSLRIPITEPIIILLYVIILPHMANRESNITGAIKEKINWKETKKSKKIVIQTSLDCKRANDLRSPRTADISGLPVQANHGCIHYSKMQLCLLCSSALLFFLTHIARVHSYTHAHSDIQRETCKRTLV